MLLPPKIEKLLAIIEHSNSPMAIRMSAAKQVGGNLAVGLIGQIEDDPWSGIETVIDRFCGCLFDSRLWDARCAASYGLGECLKAFYVYLAGEDNQFEPFRPIVNENAESAPLPAIDIISYANAHSPLLASTQSAYTHASTIHSQRHELSKAFSVARGLDDLSKDLIKDEDLLDRDDEEDRDKKAAGDAGAGTDRNGGDKEEEADATKEAAPLSARQRAQQRRDAKRRQSTLSTEHDKEAPPPLFALSPLTPSDGDSAPPPPNAVQRVLNKIFSALLEHCLSPCWQKRHGAVLGMQSALKSSIPLSRIQLLAMGSSCLSLMVLDQFCDFVGDQLTAPVKESACQCLSTIFGRLERGSDKKWIWEEGILALLREKSCGWHCRHAALLFVKHYILNEAGNSAAVAEEEIESSRRALMTKQCHDAVLSGCLEDSNEDVQALCAQILAKLAVLSTQTGNAPRIDFDDQRALACALHTLCPTKNSNGSDSLDEASPGCEAPNGEEEGSPLHKVGLDLLLALCERGKIAIPLDVSWSLFWWLCGGGGSVGGGSVKLAALKILSLTLIPSLSAQYVEREEGEGDGNEEGPEDALAAANAPPSLLLQQYTRKQVALHALRMLVQFVILEADFVVGDAEARHRIDALTKALAALVAPPNSSNAVRDADLLSTLFNLISILVTPLARSFSAQNFIFLTPAARGSDGDDECGGTGSVPAHKAPLPTFTITNKHPAHALGFKHSDAMITNQSTRIAARKIAADLLQSTILPAYPAPIYQKIWGSIGVLGDVYSCLFGLWSCALLADGGVSEFVLGREPQMPNVGECEFLAHFRLYCAHWNIRRGSTDLDEWPLDAICAYLKEEGIPELSRDFSIILSKLLTSNGERKSDGKRCEEDAKDASLQSAIFRETLAARSGRSNALQCLRLVTHRWSIRPGSDSLFDQACVLLITAQNPPSHGREASTGMPPLKNLIASMLLAPPNTETADRLWGDDLAIQIITETCSTTAKLVEITSLSLHHLDNKAGGGDNQDWLALRLLTCLHRVIQSRPLHVVSGDGDKGGVQTIIALCLAAIVPVTRKIADSNLATRKLASELFAMLVRLLPLSGIDGGGVTLPLIDVDQECARHWSALLLEGSRFVGQFLGFDHGHPPRSHQRCKDSQRAMLISTHEISHLNLNVSLRPYQQAGVNWIAFLAKYGLNGCLCDDMGLGKTVQTICILASHHHELDAGRTLAQKASKDAKPIRPKSLIVCPASLVGHWKHEIATFAPDLREPALFSGPPSTRAKVAGPKGKFSDDCQIVITSYEVARAQHQQLSAIKWQWIVLDEGHAIRNPKTKLTQAIKSLPSHHRLILSGTPIQNNVTELWSLFDWLMPGMLGSNQEFMNTFGKPIMATQPRIFNKPGAVSGAGAKEWELAERRLQELHKIVQPFLMRRMKKDVLTELPDKIIQDYSCELGDLQRRMYLARFGSGSEDNQMAGDLGESPSLADKEPDSGTLRSLTYLRKLCIHPALVMDEGDGSSSQLSIKESPKLCLLRELLEECGIVEEAASGAAETGDDEGKPASSPTIDNESAPVGQFEHRVLIFAQYNATLDLVERILLKEHLPSIKYLRLDGKVAHNDRFAMSQQFNRDPSIPIMLLTTSVGGLGLNLTGADTVIFLEHDWNPMNDLQAMDRAHRLGQRKVVNVYRLIVRDTLEEQIMGLQRFKSKLAGVIVRQQDMVGGEKTVGGAGAGGGIIDALDQKDANKTKKAKTADKQRSKTVHGIDRSVVDNLAAEQNGESEKEGDDEEDTIDQYNRAFN